MNKEVISLGLNYARRAPRCQRCDGCNEIREDPHQWTPAHTCHQLPFFSRIIYYNISDDYTLFSLMANGRPLAQGVCSDPILANYLFVLWPSVADHCQGPLWPILLLNMQPKAFPKLHGKRFWWSHIEGISPLSSEFISLFGSKKTKVLILMPQNLMLKPGSDSNSFCFHNFFK